MNDAQHAAAGRAWRRRTVRSWLRGTAGVAQSTRFGVAGDPDRDHEQVLCLGPGGQDAAGG